MQRSSGGAFPLPFHLPAQGFAFAQSACKRPSSARLKRKWQAGVALHYQPAYDITTNHDFTHHFPDLHTHTLKNLLHTASVFLEGQKPSGWCNVGWTHIHPAIEAQPVEYIGGSFEDAPCSVPCAPGSALCSQQRRDGRHGRRRCSSIHEEPSAQPQQ